VGVGGPRPSPQWFLCSVRDGSVFCEFLFPPSFPRPFIMGLPSDVALRALRRSSKLGLVRGPVRKMKEKAKR